MNREEMAQWLPHGRRLVLLEQLLHHDAVSLTVTGRAVNDPDHPLKNSMGCVPVSAGLEYASQAMALHCALSGGDDAGSPRRGYLIKVRDLSWQTTVLEPTHPPLLIQIFLETAGDDLGLYRFTIEDGAQVLMGGRLTVRLETTGAAALKAPQPPSGVLS